MWIIIFFECKFGCWMWINIFVNNNNSIECEWILTLWILHHFANHYEKCSTFTFLLFFRKIATYWPNTAWICSFFSFFLHVTDWVVFIINYYKHRVHFLMKNHRKWRYFYFLYLNVSLGFASGSIEGLGETKLSSCF